MSSVDKNQAMIDYLLTCPTVIANPLFFNFAKAKESNNQFKTISNSSSLHEPYIDGSVMKQYKFAMMTYKSISYNPMVKQSGYPDENLAEMAEFQQLIDWIKTQADSKYYPNFGSDCVIDNMKVLSDNPVLYDVDESVSPPLAKYSVTIQIDYLDKSEMEWNKSTTSI